MGSGAIGIEFASFYRAMGADVTVVEVLPQILPFEDAEIAALGAQALRKAGLKIIPSTKVVEVEKRAGGVMCDGRGRQGRDAEDRGGEADFGGRRRRQYRESRPRGARRQDRTRLHRHRRLRPHQCAGIYAIGDVAGPPMLAHKAEHEGVDLRRDDQGPEDRMRWTRP